MQLAEQLAAGSSQAEWRSAVSRAYYAAFHMARRLLEQCEFQVSRSEQAHAYLWRRLSNAGHGDTQFAGRELDSLRGQRTRADYDLDRPFPRTIVTTQIPIAKRIILILEAAALDPIKTQITDAIKIYERDVLETVTWRP
jgi:uncharacterized protein (UPF0332 family)